MIRNGFRRMWEEGDERTKGEREHRNEEREEREREREREGSESGEEVVRIKCILH